MKAILLATFALVCILPALAQAGPRLGAEAGLSQISLDYPRELDSWKTRDRVDWNAALTLLFEIREPWSFETGLRYSRLGNEIDVQQEVTQDLGSGRRGTLTNLQQYLGAPLLLRWNLPGATRTYLTGGSEVAWLIQYTNDLDLEGDSPDEGKHDDTENMNRWNVTAILGAGVALGVRSHDLELGVRYAWGLVGTSKEDLWISSWKTRELAITLGLRY